MATAPKAPETSFGPVWNKHFLRSLPTKNRLRLYQMYKEERLDLDLWARRSAEWSFLARAAQLAPLDNWRCWLFMGGRGAGKTRAGAEWLRAQIEVYGKGRAALVAPTLHDAREVMIEGVSGLRAISDTKARPSYVASRRRLEWTNGATAQIFSAEDPDSLRGPQFDTAWCDEIGAWTYDEKAWDMLMLGLRLGADPRVVATTTPRRTPLIKRLLKEEGVVLTSSTTKDNEANLSPAFISAVENLYAGTGLGRQELEGLMVEDEEGALWTLAQLDKLRVNDLPDDLETVVLALDPPASMGAKADACGAIIAGRRANGEAIVLADGTTQGLAPMDWAARAAALATQWGAAEIVVEANQGGAMIASLLEMAGWKGAIRQLHARFSKAMRAAPVSAVYRDGRVRHLGVLRALEDEMMVFGTGSQTSSPDRVDALVWAVTVLLLETSGGPSVRWV